MKKHFMEINFNESRTYYVSSELKGILNYLLAEDKLIGIIFTENDLKIIETEDFFDVTFEKLLRDNLTIIIDRNLFVAARELYDYSYLKTQRITYFSSILTYAIYMDAVFDPTICMYEGGSNNHYKALDDLKKFRIIDNLSFDKVVDLLYGNDISISNKEWSRARKRTKEIDKIEKKENYNKTLNLFKQNYPYMLKTTTILRMKGVSLYYKIKLFFNWLLDNYITKSDAMTFALYIFFNSGGMIIKGFNTNDYSKLIKLVKNATWDVTIISYLKDQAKRNPNRYYLLASYDKNLINAGRYFFSPDDKMIDNLFGKKKDDVRKMIDKINKICTQPGRESLIRKRLNNLNKTIIALENELRSSVVLQ